MNNPFLKKALPHLIAFFVFILLMSIYFSPVFTGKSLVQTDVIQFEGALKETRDYEKNTGEAILWSNSTFSGMPVWAGLDDNIFFYIHRGLKAIFAEPILLCLLGFAGFYILLSIFNVPPWLCFIGGSLYALATFNPQSIVAGHINKVYAMAYMAPVLAGVLLIIRQRFLAGIGVAALALGMQIFYGHIQISYYLFLMIIVLAVVSAIYAFKQNRVRQLFVAGGILILVALLGMGGNTTKLWTLREYGESTIRGGSELTAKAAQGTGLDKEYALSYSYGIWEIFNTFIPRFMGGGSAEPLDESSETYQALVSHNVPQQQAQAFVERTPTYWGDQPFTVGPVYLGAVSIFLFVLGLFLIKGYIKWWIVIVSALAVLLAWGRHLEWFTDIFFYYVPLYNKFRTVTMILATLQITVPLLGILALKKIVMGELENKEILKSLKYAAGICGGIALFFGLLGPSFFDFSAPNDAQLTQMVGGATWLTEAIRDDRASMMRIDSFRTLIFVLFSAGTIYFFVTGKIKATYLFLIFSGLVFFDLWPIDKKYLNNDDFQSRERLEQQAFTPTAADRSITQDTSYYRVYNLTQNPFNDGVTSYFHKSIGGYSAIKLGRYQELIEAYISKNNRPVLNMLNIKYFITADQQNNAPVARRNADAAGNAWLVDDYQLVENADAELAALESFKPRQTAIIDKRFADQLEGLTIQKSPGDTIWLASYHPMKMVYQSKTAADRLAVFSEIYYQPGWNSFIDGEPAPHMRADYVLRAMKIPAGDHTIEFRFEPNSFFVGTKISIASSIVLVIVLLLVIIKPILDKRKGKTEEKPEVLF